MSISVNDIGTHLTYRRGHWQQSKDPCEWSWLVCLGDDEAAKAVADLLTRAAVLPTNHFCMGTQQAAEALELLRWLWEFYEDNASPVGATATEFDQFTRVRTSLLPKESE